MKRAFLTIAGVIACLLVFTGCSSQEPQAAQTYEQDLTGTVMLGNLTLTVNETGIRNQVVPPDPYGYYNYYQEYDGYQYYVAAVSVKNTGETAVDPTTVLVRADMPDETTAEGKLVLLNEIDSDFRETLDGGRECNGFLFILAKQEAGTPQNIRVYYNRDFTTPENVQQYDMEAILHVIA